MVVCRSLSLDFISLLSLLSWHKTDTGHCQYRLESSNVFQLVVIVKLNMQVIKFLYTNI